MGEDAEVRWLGHDADLRLRVRAPGAEALFAAAARAVVGASLAEPPAGGARRVVRLEEPDREALLVAWLNEILYLLSSGEFLPARFERVEIDGNVLAASLAGAPAGEKPPRFLREIKAATFHGLAVEERNGIWGATILFDI